MPPVPYANAVPFRLLDTLLTFSDASATVDFAPNGLLLKAYLLPLKASNFGRVLQLLFTRKISATE